MPGPITTKWNRPRPATPIVAGAKVALVVFLIQIGLIFSLTMDWLEPVWESIVYLYYPVAWILSLFVPHSGDPGEPDFGRGLVIFHLMFPCGLFGYSLIAGLVAAYIQKRRNRAAAA